MEPKGVIVAAARTTRAWAWVIALVAMVLVLVVAAGAWARWRPLSDHDAARLAARDIVAAVAESPDTHIPQETSDRQLSALGPAATPAQRERLNEQLDPGPLSTAVSRLTELASDQEDAELAATMAAIAASWSATAARTDSDAPLAMDVAAGDPLDVAAAQRCTPELTALATQLDRARYTAQAAEAREDNGTDFSAAALRQWQDGLDRLHDAPEVAPLYACDPHPARGGYQLPPNIAGNAPEAAGHVAGDVSEYAAAALAASAPAERPWLMASLETSARAQALLQPQDPVPALVGDITVTGR